MDEPDADANAGPRPLEDDQRRVLGVLIEKSLTTPDAYPMTLNAIVAGCNQKSNRSPVVQFDADDVEQALDSLNEADLVNVVITSGGHVERYRQLSRVVFGWGEEDVAIMAELMLRGRQTCGELRSRASRMKQIESLDRLRERLEDLQHRGFVRASGPLRQRGVEVDHCLYDGVAPELPTAPAATTAANPATASTAAPSGVSTDAGIPARIEKLEQTVQALRDQVDTLRDEVTRLGDRLDSVL